MTSHPNKRKAVDLTLDEDDDDLDWDPSSNPVDFIKPGEDDVLPKFVSFLESTDERMEAIVLDALAVKAKKLGPQSQFHQSLEAIVKAPEDDEEDSSDDEVSVMGASDKQWMENFHKIVVYKMNNGDCKVPGGYKKDPKLAKWVANQRFLYNNLKTGKKTNTLSVKRVTKLDSIGFFWGKKYGEPKSWESMYQELCEYREALGDCNVKFDKENPTDLAKWVAMQRSEFKKCKRGRPHTITLEQIKNLKAIGFNFKRGKRL